MSIPAIRAANVEEQQQTLATMVLGFAADPLVRWMWPDPLTYFSRGPAIFSAFGGKAFASFTAFVTNDFAGAALWLPPGVKGEQSVVERELSATIDASRLGEVRAVFEAMARYVPQDPCWYLPAIAVDPATQGKGIGTALMAYALERVDEGGTPAYLESSNPRNVQLYEGFGFEVIAEVGVGAGPVVYPMLRPGAHKQ
ncbi:MAG: N-acetyltransferase [Pseudomonadota bacterium]